MTRPFSRLGTDFAFSAVMLAGLTSALGAVAAGALALGADFVVRGTAAFAAVIIVVGTLAMKSQELERFGPANRITLLRAGLIALVAACIGETPSPALVWTIIVVVTAVLFVDGLDGRIARHTRSATAFGARFDMETDAALIMILSVLCWQFGKAGAWILLAGLLRYGFVIAARALSWMQRPLPPSRRRQTVCIVQSGCLLGVMSPVFPVPASDWLAAGTLIMLTTSFAIDVHWLWQTAAQQQRA